MSAISRLTSDCVVAAVSEETTTGVSNVSSFSTSNSTSGAVLMMATVGGPPTSQRDYAFTQRKEAVGREHHSGRGERHLSCPVAPRRLRPAASDAEPHRARRTGADAA